MADVFESQGCSRASTAATGRLRQSQSFHLHRPRSPVVTRRRYRSLSPSPVSRPSRDPYRSSSSFWFYSATVPDGFVSPSLSSKADDDDDESMVQPAAASTRQHVGAANNHNLDSASDEDDDVDEDNDDEDEDDDDDEVDALELHNRHLRLGETENSDFFLVCESLMEDPPLPSNEENLVNIYPEEWPHHMSLVQTVSGTSLNERVTLCLPLMNPRGDSDDDIDEHVDDDIDDDIDDGIDDVEDVEMLEQEPARGVVEGMAGAGPLGGLNNALKESCVNENSENDEVPPAQPGGQEE